MGDFHRWAGHEGRRVWLGVLNVGSSAFHEGRGAGKKTTPGGHDLVNRKKCFRKKRSYGRESMLILDQGKIGSVPGMFLWGKTGFPILDFFGQ
jgi:hypothetical protein